MKAPRTALYLLPTLLLGILFLNACEDDPVSKSSLLTNDAEKTWGLAARTFDGLPDFLNECEQGIELKFNSNGTWLEQFTDVECGDLISEGSWEFNPTEDEINFTSISGDGIWELNTLTEDSLVLLFNGPVITESTYLAK